MVLLHPPFERQNQIVPLTAQLPSGKVRHRLGRGAVPSIRAFNMSLPETRKTSLATLASLMLAVSRSFRSRLLRSAAWLSTSLRR